MNFCKDCEWFCTSIKDEDPKCASPNYTKTYDLVYGTMLLETCIEMRASHLCNKEGELFEPKGK